MDQQTLLTIFVGLATLAMLIQAVMLVVMAVVALKLQKKIMPLLGPAQGILETSKRMVEKVEGHVDRISTSVEGHIDKIGSSSNAILDTTKQQLVKVDGLLSDATTRAKSQMDRAEMVLDDTFTRVHQTVSTVQSGVIRPVREVQGLFAGVKGALSYLSKSGRATVDHATSDEEMFI
jgi:signal transduction histidine kinase